MSAESRPVATLVAVVVVQFMASLDLSVVNVALPAVQADLGFSDGALQWVINAYTLVYGGFILLGGRLGDLLGQRTVLLGGLAVFGAASLAGGLAQTPGQLVAARAAQGLGAAVLSPVTLALVAVTFPAGPSRSRALGLWGASTVLGGAVGVVASGLLTQAASWRWVLLINLPIVLVAVLATVAGVGAGQRQGTPRLDLAGAVLVTTGMAVLILGVVRTEELSWGAPATVATLALAALLLAGFVVVERRVAQPLVRLQLFGNRAVVGGNVFGFLITAGQLAGFYFVSLYMQRVLGRSPVATGVAFLPFCVGAAAGMWAATAAMQRVGARAVLALGGLVGGVGIAWFGLAEPGGNFTADLLGPSLLASVGIGGSFVAMGNAAMTGVAPTEAGMVSGLLSASRQLGGAIGLAVLTTIAAGVTAGASGSPAERLDAGYSAALFAGGALIVLGAMAAWLLVPGRAPQPSPAPELAGAVPRPES